MKQRHFRRLLGAALLFMGLSQSALANVFINEFHYDNVGGDVGEFVEIAGTAGTDVSGWSIVLYNGANNLTYSTLPLTGTLTNQCNGTGISDVPLPLNGLQNGAPDGIALIDNMGTVIEFISYEGAFTAAGGPAVGVTSTDIGVAESGATAIGQSLQLSTAGWTGPLPESPGNCNASQVLAQANAPVNVPIFGPFGLLVMLLGLYWVGSRSRHKT